MNTINYEDYSVTALFPTYLFSYDLIKLGYVNEEYLSQLKDAILEMRTKDPIGRRVSNAYTGWQSNDGCESHSRFTRLYRAFNRITQSQLTPFFGLSPSEVQVTVSNVWANVNDKGAWNYPHLHNGCWYSGVFYIDADEDSGDLHIIDTHTKVVADYPFGRRQDCSANIKPQTGKLLLFPSGLMHMVEANQTDKDRISIAFNLNHTYLKGRVIGQPFEYVNNDPRGNIIKFNVDNKGNPVYPPNLEYLGDNLG